MISSQHQARFEVITFVLLNTHIFWDVTLCSWVCGFWHFKPSCTFMFKG